MSNQVSLDCWAVRDKTDGHVLLSDNKPQYNQDAKAWLVFGGERTTIYNPALFRSLTGDFTTPQRIHIDISIQQ